MSSSCATATTPWSSATRTTPSAPRAPSARNRCCSRTSTGRRRGSRRPPLLERSNRSRRGARHALEIGLVAGRGRAAAARRPRRPRVRRAGRAHPVRGRDDRARRRPRRSESRCCRPGIGTSGTRRRRPTAGHCATGSCRRSREHVAVSGLPVGMGASLGGLAMLQAQRTWPEVFAGLFLQSGSFFVPRFDRQESALSRATRGSCGSCGACCARATFDEPVPVSMTCGAEEENIHNNRLMASGARRAGLRRAARRGARPAQLHELARRASIRT